MNRLIQPEIQHLTNLSIKTPERSLCKNGIPITSINIGEQDVVRLDILFEGGRWRQTQKLQSIFTNRMIKEGTKRFTSNTIAEKLDYYGAWLELSSSSNYEFITLYSLNKYFNQTLEIIESIIKEPIFPENELEIVVNTNIQQFLVNSSKVDFIAHRQLLKSLYGDHHPCGILVEEEDYRRVEPDILKAFHDKYYQSNDCAIFVSGKVTDDILKSIEGVFGDFPFGNTNQLSPLPIYPINIASDKRVFIDRPDSTQSSVKLGHHIITRKDPDYLKLRVLIKLFGGYFGSRLMTNIREDKGYTYGISAGTLFYPDSGILAINAETDSKYVELLIAEIYNEIDKLQSNLIPADELRMVKNYMIGEMCRNYESPFSLSDAWIFIYTTQLNDSYFNDSLQAIQDVTVDELKILANKYLCKETLKEVIAGKITS